jgi:hypothetical protein
MKVPVLRIISPWFSHHPVELGDYLHPADPEDEDDGEDYGVVATIEPRRLRVRTCLLSPRHIAWTTPRMIPSMRGKEKVGYQDQNKEQGQEDPGVLDELASEIFIQANCPRPLRPAIDK